MGGGVAGFQGTYNGALGLAAQVQPVGDPRGQRLILQGGKRRRAPGSQQFLPQGQQVLLPRQFQALQLLGFGGPVYHPVGPFPLCQKTGQAGKGV